MNNPKFILGVVVVIFIVGGLLYVFNPTPEEYTNPDKIDEGEIIACTADAKLCPDGSYVGRIPPDCQFAPCPIDGKNFPPDAVFEDGTIIE